MRPSRYNLEIAIDGGMLLVNLLSRAVLELDRDSFELFKSLHGDEAAEITDDEIANFAQVLRSGLFLIDGDFDELAYLRQRVRHDRYDDQELAVVIAPTMGCNFSCHYCFEDKPEAQMTREAEQELLDYVGKRLVGKKVLTVQWFGGEPLKAIDSVERLSRALMIVAERHGAAYSAAIVTNGHFLSKEVAKLLKSLKVKSAQLTLDGNKRLHDRTRRGDGKESSFERLLGNIMEAGPFIDVNLRVHVAPFSVTAVKSLLADLAARGIGKAVKTIYFAPLFSYKPSNAASAQFLLDGKRFFDAESFAAVEVDLFRDLRRLHLPMPDLLDAPFSVCTAVRNNAIVVGPSGRFTNAISSWISRQERSELPRGESHRRPISATGLIMRLREMRNAARANSFRSVSAAVRTNGRKGRQRNQYARACATTPLIFLR
jgi:uncharacterized protein